MSMEQPPSPSTKHDAAPDDPERRAFIQSCIIRVGTALTAASLSKLLSNNNQHPLRQEKIKRTRTSPSADNATDAARERTDTPAQTLAYRLRNGIPIADTDGPSLACAAYESYRHHLQTYRERKERDDFLHGCRRIAEYDIDALIDPFTQRGISPHIALGLPLHESFFTPRARSRSNALGTHQIKLRTAIGILRADNVLRERYADLLAELDDTKRRSHAKTEIARRLLDDPVFSATISAAILAAEMAAYPNDENLALTAYNTGRQLRGIRGVLQKAGRALTYEHFTIAITQRIVERLRTYNTSPYYVIQPGDTVWKLKKMFPQYSSEELIQRLGGTTYLKQGASTRLPDPNAPKRYRTALSAIAPEREALEYAAKVRAAADVLVEYDTPASQYVRNKMIEHTLT